MSNRRKTNDIASMQFYKFDKWLLMEEGLKKLSPTAKMLYMIIKDREELSLKNAKAFTDKDGYLFQYFDQQSFLTVQAKNTFYFLNTYIFLNYCLQYSLKSRARPW